MQLVQQIARPIAIVAGLALFLSETAAQNRPTAADVLTWCEPGISDAYNLGRCEAQLQFAAREGLQLPEWQCVPVAVLSNTDQLRRLFIREGQRMPEIPHQEPKNLLFYVLAKAFPCPLRMR